MSDPERPARSGIRAFRALACVVVGTEAIWIAGIFIASWATSPSFGLDYRWHMDAARRLIEVGTPYWPWQVTGPYPIGNGAILYPPTAFLLFVPFLWLPAALWWAVPIGVLGACLAWHRPPLWAWVIIGGLLAFEKSLNVFVFGNPGMWIVAAVAAGTVLGWPSVFVLAKPTFAPLALIGIHRRSWWVTLVVLGLASIPFGRAWLDWVAVVRNSDVSALYSLPTLPLMLAPIVAWLAGRRRPIAAFRGWVTRTRARRSKPVAAT